MYSNLKKNDNKVKPYAIGLDLGGTNSVFGIVDEEGGIVAERNE